MDYKENTTGWWLSQLKEPLRSRALEGGANSLHEHCMSLEEAIDYIYEMGEYPDEDNDFWLGVHWWFYKTPVDMALKPAAWHDGIKMASKCAPEPNKEENAGEIPPHSDFVPRRGLPVQPKFEIETPTHDQVGKLNVEGSEYTISTDQTQAVWPKTGEQILFEKVEVLENRVETLLAFICERFPQFLEIYPEETWNSKR